MRCASWSLRKSPASTLCFETQANFVGHQNGGRVWPGLGNWAQGLRECVDPGRARQEELGRSRSGLSNGGWSLLSSGTEIHTDVTLVGGSNVHGAGRSGVFHYSEPLSPVIDVPVTSASQTTHASNLQATL